MDLRRKIGSGLLALTLAMTGTQLALVETAQAAPPPGMQAEPTVGTSSTGTAAVDADTSPAGILVNGVCCLPSYKISRSTADPAKTLIAEWYAAITIENGWPTAVDSVTAGGTAAWQARSVHGIDSIEKRNYYILNMSPYSVTSWEGNSAGDSKYGMTMVMWDGNIFEGCEAGLLWGQLFFNCDYFSTKWSAPWPKGGNGTDLFLKKTVDWFAYAGDFLGCASALTGTLIYNKSWSAPALASCVKGPIGGWWVG